MKISADYKALPTQTDSKSRRASLILLQDAAAGVIRTQERTDQTQHLAAFLLNAIRATEKERKARRETMPANMTHATSQIGGDVVGKETRNRRATTAGPIRSSITEVTTFLRNLGVAPDEWEKED